MTKKLICKNCGKEIKDIEKIIYASFTFEIDEEGIFQKKELIPQEYYDEYIDRTRIVCDCGNDVDIDEQSNEKFCNSMEKFNEQFSVEDVTEECLNIRECVKKYMEKNKIGMAESHLECWFKEKYAGEDKDTVNYLLTEEHDNSGLLEELDINIIDVTEEEKEYAVNVFIETVLSRIDFGGAGSWRDSREDKRT